MPRGSHKRLYDLDNERDFVAVLYRVVFGREADPEGLAGC